ncbi:MAG TPA: DUF4402 domain-containing protein [Pedobacter sp.]|jgi:hypothetical protein
MNKFTKGLAALTLSIFGFSAVSFAQASATATAEAIVVTPIAITRTVDMNFGNVAVNANGGTVVLAPSNAARTVSANGVVLPSTTGTVTAASFTVTGQAGYTFAITLPNNATPTTLTRVNGNGESMTVNAFTSFPSGVGTLTGGTQVVNVGATLNVGNTQAAGQYLSGTPFSVTVVYN